MTTRYVTLRFPDYATAVEAAKLLGFWQTLVPESVDSETGETIPERGELLQSGQTIRPDGSAFSWAIDEIGQLEDGYYVNATGELPAEVEPFIVPYGSGGRIFAGTDDLVEI